MEGEGEGAGVRNTLCVCRHGEFIQSVHQPSQSWVRESVELWVVGTCELLGLAVIGVTRGELLEPGVWGGGGGGGRGGRGQKDFVCVDMESSSSQCINHPKL